MFSARARLHWTEWGVLAVFVLAGFSVFALNAIDAAMHGRVFLGADGRIASDQLQYLAWATDAARHVLSSDLYAFHLGGHVFLQPVFLLTGLLHVYIGLSYPLLLAAWKLVAIGALFGAVYRYARSLAGVNPLKVSLVLALALFMVSPTYLVINGGHIGSPNTISDVGALSQEIFPVQMISGYFPLALAVAASTVVLIQLDALPGKPAKEQRHRVLLAGGAGIAASWLHPWQGVIILLILVGTAAWERPRGREILPLAACAFLTGLPLVYYAALSKVDAAWAKADLVSGTGAGRPQVLMLLLTLAPLVVVTLPGYALRPATRRERMLQLWPPAIVVTYLVSPAGAYEAIGGLTIPVAVLMVRGWPYLRARLSKVVGRRTNVVAALGLCILAAAPAAVMVRRLSGFRQGSQANAQITQDDAHVLGLLAGRGGPGGVLTTMSVGAWVPALTNRPTWVGHPIWSPDWISRNAKTQALFDGAYARDPEAGRAFVNSTGARFVVQPCEAPGQAAASLLRPMGFRERRMGCAALFWRPS
jgi:hypothetical protein